MTRRASRSIIVAIASAAWALSGPAYALDQDRIKISPFSTYAYDSNVFRLPEGIDPRTVIGRSERSDRVISAGVRVALDYPIGRQRVLAEGRAARNDFDRFDFLDHTATDARATLKWQLGNDWNGDLGYSHTRALTSFGDFRLPVRNMETRQNPYALARYRFMAAGALRMRISQYTTENSTIVRRTSDLDQISYEGGLEFMPSTGNTIGALIRHTSGDFPNRQFLPGGLFDNSFTQDDYEATFVWRLSGHSLISGYAGYVKREHSQVPQQDFDGPTGRFTYEYTPTGKVKLTTIVRREIVPYEDIGSSYALTDSVTLIGEWAATSKIVFSAKAEYRERDFLTDTARLFVGLPQRTDKTKSVSFGAAYRPYSFLELALALARERRSSNLPLQDYDVTTASLTAQFTF